ncbi:MAG: DegT/DnrJ/EryC1/StrS family aminotransferase, partial [Candidatus Omnitrophota bacterium]
GTEALYISLLACDIQPGDEVITVANAGVPTVCAITLTGAKPVFADIKPESYTIDVSKI